MDIGAWRYDSVFLQSTSWRLQLQVFQPSSLWGMGHSMYPLIVKPWQWNMQESNLRWFKGIWPHCSFPIHGLLFFKNSQILTDICNVCFCFSMRHDLHVCSPIIHVLAEMLRLWGRPTFRCTRHAACSGQTCGEAGDCPDFPGGGHVIVCWFPGYFEYLRLFFKNLLLDRGQRYKH